MIYEHGASFFEVEADSRYTEQLRILFLLDRLKNL